MMNLQSESNYMIISIVLLLFPILTAIQHYWLASGIFLLGFILFLYSVFSSKPGWDDLADIATLIVIVLPIYIVGGFVWIWSSYKRRMKKRQNSANSSLDD
jgi:peptidoglycan/LPS O-acetylase OafA/YrhL